MNRNEAFQLFLKLLRNEHVTTPHDAAIAAIEALDAFNHVFGQATDDSDLPVEHEEPSDGEGPVED